MGGVGFVWLIIAALTKKQVTNFLMYHIMQSIFLSILYFLIVTIGGMLMIVINKIPFMGLISLLIISPIPLFFGLSFVQLVSTTIILYLAITSFMGFYSYLPWVSDVIKGNVGR